MSAISQGMARSTMLLMTEHKMPPTVSFRAGKPRALMSWKLDQAAEKSLLPVLCGEDNSG